MSKRRVSGLLDDALLEQEADSDAAETRISDSILMERLASFKIKSALNAANSIETGRVILALHGWEPLDTALKCHLCTRVVRTLKYTSDNDSEPAAFDPVLEHRWYCPWIHAFESGRETGVEVVRDSLERVYEVDSEDPEFLGLVRRRWESGSSDGAVTPARPRKKVAASPAVGKEPGSGLKEGSFDMKSVQAARASLKSLFQDLE
ncbi:hypothetical protein HDU77_007984 [Chytriomyces hyalinus]|nr:hypothetical protein HDU77_007984 [Chytriomyces hyalinus]